MLVTTTVRIRLELCTIFEQRKGVVSANGVVLRLHDDDVSFLPRDATRKRGLCFHPVSIRPSVTLSAAESPNFFLDPIAPLF